MSQVVGSNIDGTFGSPNYTKLDEVKLVGGVKSIFKGEPAKPHNTIKVSQALIDRENELAKQQAVMQEFSQMSYSGLTDKFFGKQGGWSFERPLRLGAYIIVGAVVGKYIAKKMNKSTTFGMVIGGLAPLLAYQLSIQYDRKKMPKQEPKKPVAIEPYMPQVQVMSPSQEREMAIKFYKTLPDEFVLNNVTYSKNSNLEFYKHSFSTSGGFSGMPPIKISGAEFSDAYIKFRDKI